MGHEPRGWRDEMAGKKREDIPDAGATMQLDAIVDDLDDIAAPGGYGPSMPPPLPPKKVSPVVWVIGGLVVALMIALGVGAGFVLFGGEAEPVVQPAPAAEPGPGVVQMEEVVFEPAAEER